jgi:amino acid adenylation domain-containing protein
MNRKLIHSVFENTVVENEDKIAVEQKEYAISYKELNRFANLLGNVLLNLGLKPENIVATLFNHDVRNIISVLSVFKSGGIYMPLGFQFRSRHWNVIDEQIKPEILITSEDFMNHAKNFSTRAFKYIITLGINPFDLSVYKNESGAYTKITIDTNLSTENLAISVSPEDPNYLFFSSGTTGTPKAILGMHKSLSHFINWESAELKISNGDRVSHLISNTFDASLRDIFLPLINGSTLCIPEKEIFENIASLIEWIGKEEVSVIHTVPSLFRVISENFKGKESKVVFPKLNYILLAGEMLFNKDIHNWRNNFGSNTQIINLYGPTEATMVKTFFRIGNLSGDLNDKISVGFPISLTAIIILNTDGRLCAINEIGEVYIRTPFLTKGYYNNTELTSKYFIQNPLDNTSNEIVYKTGDYGKYLADRSIMILGRKDDVVKVNGVRIDLSDIESIILGHQDILQVKCILHEDKSESVIICYYTARKDLDGSKLRNHCQSILASYEIPAFFVKLDKLPLSANGKVDKLSLPLPETLGTNSGVAYLAPQNEIQEKLMLMWRELLTQERIGIQDNFFELGGHSFKLIQLISRISKEFNVKINPETLFKNPSIEGISGEIEKTYLANNSVFQSDNNDNNNEKYLI